MVEILLFAVLSVYLFYRLWSVLGTRTGHEKQRQWPRSENSDDNVIILPQKSNAKEAPPVIIDVPQPFAEQIKTIQKSMKDFSAERFIAGACKVFRAVLSAFAKGDNDRLENLVAGNVSKEFQQVIKGRLKRKETLSIDVKDVDAEISDITLNKTIAQILVCFTSDQVVTTTDKSGEIIDNTNQLTNRMIDRWTFQKDLKDPGLIWLLVKTKSVAL